MWNLKKGVQFLPNTTINQLQKIYKQETKAKPKMRLLAAIHRKKGKSLDDIAYHVNASLNAAKYHLRKTFRSRKSMPKMFEYLRD